MPEWISAILGPVWDAIGALVLAGGGGAIVAVAVMRLFGESWLNHRFSKKMAQFTHEQDQQIERLRFKANALFDRRTKLHQREFEIVPQAWAHLVSAHHALAVFLAPFQQYPDLDRMNEAQLDSFLEKVEFSSYQKEQLKTSGKKTDLYIKFEY